jgi:hypothetical protein
VIPCIPLFLLVNKWNGLPVKNVEQRVFYLMFLSMKIDGLRYATCKACAGRFEESKVRKTEL